MKNTSPLFVETLITVKTETMKHHGISLRGLTRAMLTNIKEGSFVQGGAHRNN